MPGRAGSGQRRSFLLGCLLAWLGAALQPAENLDVVMEPHVTAFLNKNISLPCKISGYSTPELDIKRMAVTWYLKITGGNDRRTVYSVIAGTYTPHRIGAELDLNKLKRGDATLFLPQVQLNESGTYICSVTVTPDRVDKMTVFEIVARPDIILSHKKLTIEWDKEKTVSCAVNKFYPDSIVIQWEKDSKHTSDKSVPAEDICTGTSVVNEDGTFNITSKLKLQPSLDDDGNIYNCTVKHKSFSNESVHSLTLTVTEPQRSNIWVAWLVGVVAVLSMVTIFLYFRWIRKIPPTMMTFVGNEILKNLEESQLQCLFSGFRPMPLEITYFLIEPNNGKQKIVSWNTKAASDPEQSDETWALLKKQEMFNISQTLSKTKMRTSEVSSKIIIIPDVKKLPEFDLTVEIRHEALPNGLRVVTQSFQVISLLQLDTIQCSTDLPRADEPLTLSCKIYKYFPNAIETCWWKEGERVQEDPSVTDPKEDLDGLFSCESSIKFFPKAEDIGKRFICKARLKEFQNWFIESAWQMNSLVCIPKVSHIECDPNEPELGKPITLSCVVQDFYPPECGICWKKDMKELTHATIKTWEPEQDPVSNLYNMKSQVSFTANPEDHAAEFVVEINHSNKITRNTYTLMLKGLPKVADIFHDPSNAEYGHTLCLSCEVMDFYPRDINIQWLDGDNLVTNGVATEEPVLKSNGCFRLTSSYRLIPTALDYNKSISFKVNHKKLAEPITKRVSLNLPGKPPVLSEIKASRPFPSGNVILEISISDFAPHGIQVTWYEDWKILTESINSSINFNKESKLYYMTSKITIVPKLNDTEKTIRCEVRHTETRKIQEKSFVLKGRDLSDSTEQISPALVNPNAPSASLWPVNEGLMQIECATSLPIKAGEKVTFRCFVPGKEANEAKVFWYKGLYEVKEEIKNTNSEDGTGFISYVSVKTEEGKDKCPIRCEVWVDDEVSIEKSYILELI